MSYSGIDYGRGITNIDTATGIRYGVIPANAVGQSWYDEAKAYYGEPTCPTCTGYAVEGDDSDYWCKRCEKALDSDEVYSDEALSYSIDTPELRATQGQDGDIFVIFSKHVTRAAFCSPCAPGACYLLSPNPDGPLAYCFGPDWFEDEKAPYPIEQAD